MDSDYQNLPHSQPNPEQQWLDHFRTHAVVTADLLRYRYGQPRPNIVLFEFPLQVPHTGHRDYALVETSKKFKKEAEEHQRIRTMRMPVVRAMPSPCLTGVFPDIRQMNRALKLHFPR